MKVVHLPKDAIALGTGYGWRARTIFWSSSKKKYYAAAMFPLIDTKYDVSPKTKIIPKGFHTKPVDASVARRMALSGKERFPLVYTGKKYVQMRKVS